MERFVLPSMYELCLLHTRSDRALRNLVAKKLELQQLTLMEWLTLGAVATGPRAGLSMTEIANTLNVTLPQVTALIAGLLERKLVKQKVLSSDHRGRQTTATLKGKRVLSKLESSITTDIRKHTKTVPNSQLRDYMRVMQRLSEQVE